MKKLLRTRYSKFLFSICLIVAFFACTFRPLSAQALCAGRACSAIPISSNDFTIMLGSLKYQFADVLAEDMARAALASHLIGLPIGTVNLEKDEFTFGLALSAGYEEKHYLFVVIPGFGTMANIESAGVGANPRIFVGANLALLMPARAKRTQTSAALNPSRFDIYFSLFKYKLSENAGYNFDLGRAIAFEPQRAVTTSGTTVTYDPNKAIIIDPLKSITVGKQRELSTSSMGFDVHYHLMEKREIYGGTLLEFLGLSAGIGLHRTTLNLSQLEDNGKITFDLANNSQLIWEGFSRTGYELHADSLPLEIKSGVRALHFFNFTMAGGYAFTKGNVSLDYQKFGSVYVREQNLFQAFTGTADSYLFVNLLSEATVKTRTGYLKPGIEFDFHVFKIMLEGMYTEDAEAVTLGFRGSF